MRLTRLIPGNFCGFLSCTYAGLNTQTTRLLCRDYRAQIAYNVAKAFSSGAKSAPAEFTEVQSLLYSVTQSLELLSRILPQASKEGEQGGLPSQATIPPDDKAYIILANVYTNCTGVLKDLEHFVGKYMILDKNAASGKNERKWRDEIKKNWKNVVWTKGGGDIVKLKQTLTAHIHALSLVIQVMNGDRQTEIQGRVETYKDVFAPMSPMEHHWSPNQSTALRKLTRIAAQEYLEILKATKQRLPLYYLQRPRWGEQILFQKDVENQMIRNLVLSDAKLTIILDPSTGKYRMILSRSDHSAAICFELPQDFLEEIATRTIIARPNYPAWFVEVGKHDFSIVRQGSGIDALSTLRQDNEG